MRAYFDTSVVVTLTLQEDRWPELSRWIVRQMPVPFYSDFGWGEYVSAVGLKVRRNEMTWDQGRATLEAIEVYLRSWKRIRTTRNDLASAALMVREFGLGLRFPDAIHIATAQRTGLSLVSGDNRQLTAAAHFGISSINPFDS